MANFLTQSQAVSLMQRISTWVSQLLAGKANKVSSPTSGNFVSLDADGNLVNSGHKHSDYKTKQTAVPDPIASEYIDEVYDVITSISQDSNGVIAPVKKILLVEGDQIYDTPNHEVIEEALPTVSAVRSGLLTRVPWRQYTYRQGAVDENVDLAETDGFLAQGADGMEPYFLPCELVTDVGATPDQILATRAFVNSGLAQKANLGGSSNQNFACGDLTADHYVIAEGVKVIGQNSTGHAVLTYEGNGTPTIQLPTSGGMLALKSDVISAALAFYKVTKSSGQTDLQALEALPAADKKTNYIYLIATSGSNPNSYAEYIYVVPTSGNPYFELLGSSEMDLSNYWSKTELQAMSSADFNSALDTYFPVAA